MRYSRQELFSKIGKKGQEIIRKSSITIVGAGALGSRCAELLARAGIGKLIMIDRDILELDNLQRQTLYEESDVGKAKADLVKTHISKINRDVEVISHVVDLEFDNVDLMGGDLILGCTDNLYSRLLINDFSKKKNIAWIHGGAIESYGNLFVSIPGQACFRCIFDQAGTDTCDTSGVLNTIPAIIASLQVSEAIKLLLKKDCEKDLIYFDSWNNQLNRVTVRKNPKCPACKGDYSYLDGLHVQPYQKLCGAYQFKGNNKVFPALKKRLAKAGEVKDFGSFIIFKEMTIFNDGRVMIKAKDMSAAKSIYSKYIGN